MAADQNRSIQALAAGPVMSERSAARSVLTWGAPVWKATTSAVCHQPPSGFAEAAWVEDTAVTLPSDAVRAALTLLRSVAHAGCVVSQEPTIAGVANTEPTPYELAVKPALYTRHDGGKSLVLSTTSFAAALSWARLAGRRHGVGLL